MSTAILRATGRSPKSATPWNHPNASITLGYLHIAAVEDEKARELFG